MSNPNEHVQARHMAERVARESYGKLVAFLAARSRDVAAAEDALSDAFAAALGTWPATGCPTNPEAWLMTVASRRLIDASRRRATTVQAQPELERLASEILARDLESTPSRAEIPDHRLALMFTCAHPEIDPAIRSPLMLQAVLGLDAATIASAFLVSPAAMGQRLARAKRRIREAGVPFAVPARDELAERLAAVLDAIYAAFAEGWSDAAGTDPARRNLADEAVFLGRLVAALLPDPEAFGLLALMLHAEARRPARRNAQGEYVPFAEQDPSAWDAQMIDAAEALLARASRHGVIGRYQLEAALQSAHVHRRRTRVDNWSDVVALYDALLSLSPSPVVAINCALAVAELDGANAAIVALDAVAEDPRLVEYQPYWAARAELLSRTGARTEARRAYDLAIGLERDAAVRRFLQRRQAELNASQP